MILPINCSVEYHKLFLSSEESKTLFDYLLSLNQLSEMAQVVIPTGDSFQQNYGKLMFVSKNLFEENRFPESIWGKTMVWTQEMELIKNRVENFAGIPFETCVCIYYPDGNSGVDYHSDLTAFGDTNIIPSISLGEERVFYLREKSTLKEHKILLENGSLIIMGEHCQDRYEHSLPINSDYKKGRINLTFRQYGFK